MKYKANRLSLFLHQGITNIVQPSKQKHQATIDYYGAY